MKNQKTAVQTAIVKWCGNPPDWVVALAAARDKSSNAKLSILLGFSAPTISQIINNKYLAKDRSNIERAVRGKLMHKKVECPILGEIDIQECHLNRIRMVTEIVNPIQTQLYHNCPNCQFGRVGGDYSAFN